MWCELFLYSVEQHSAFAEKMFKKRQLRRHLTNILKTRDGL